MNVYVVWYMNVFTVLVGDQVHLFYNCVPKTVLLLKPLSWHQLGPLCWMLRYMGAHMLQSLFPEKS